MKPLRPFIGGWIHWPPSYSDITTTNLTNARKSGVEIFSANGGQTEIISIPCLLLTIGEPMISNSVQTNRDECNDVRWILSPSEV